MRNKVGKVLRVKLNYKEGLNIIYKLYFSERLKERFKFLKKEVFVIKFYLYETLLD